MKKLSETMKKDSSDSVKYIPQVEVYEALMDYLQKENHLLIAKLNLKI